MKNKINIMDRRQDITDEELERFKNFDALLSKHYRILNEKKPVTWKLIIPAIVLVGSIAIYWWMNNNANPTEKQTPQSESVSLPEKVKDNTTREATPVITENKKAEKSKAENQIKAIESSTTYDKPKIDSVTTEVTPLPEVQPAQSDVPKPEITKTETVYVQAEPVDGYEALYTYFSKELIYPEAAVKDSIEGVLTVKFLINKEGRPEKIQTSGALGVLFDKEAVRLIEHMPLWKPATLNGKPITSKLSLPLTFQLRNKK